MDGFLTASSSRILPRLHNDRLDIQLEAFRFQQEPSGVVGGGRGYGGSGGFK